MQIRTWKKTGRRLENYSYLTKGYFCIPNRTTSSLQSFTKTRERKRDKGREKRTVQCLPPFFPPLTCLISPGESGEEERKKSKVHTANSRAQVWCHTPGADVTASRNRWYRHLSAHPVQLPGDHEAPLFQCTQWHNLTCLSLQCYQTNNTGTFAIQVLLYSVTKQTR